MLDDFLVRAALAGIGVALATGALGCFVVWRRMAYFGDATSHGAILGVALALAADGPIWAWVVAVAMAIGLALQGLMARGFAADTALGVLAHGALAAGLVAISLLPNIRIDIDSYLFGDILTVNRRDLAVIWIGAALVLALVIWRWQSALTATLHPDLARAAGFSPRREELILTVLMALVVSVALKVVGALLITAMLIIPAATSARLTRSPEAMAVGAIALGVAAVMGGLKVSLWADTPVGPTAICVAMAAFILANLVKLAAPSRRDP